MLYILDSQAATITFFDVNDMQLLFQNQLISDSTSLSIYEHC